MLFRGGKGERVWSLTIVYQDFLPTTYYLGFGILTGVAVEQNRAKG